MVVVVVVVVVVVASLLRCVVVFGKREVVLNTYRVVGRVVGT